jgi:hypothetical protein
MIVASVGCCPVCGEQHSIPEARSFDRKRMGCDDLVQMHGRKRIVDSSVDPGNDGKDYQPDPGSNPYTSDLGRRFFDNGQ